MRKGRRQFIKALEEELEEACNLLLRDQHQRMHIQRWAALKDMDFESKKDIWGQVTLSSIIILDYVSVHLVCIAFMANLPTGPIVAAITPFDSVK